MFTAFDSFPLMAIPFFILAGGLMETGGISTRIVRFASTLVGHFRGGLGMVAVLSCMLFSGVSGSAVADAAAIGAALIPAMTRRDYDPAFSSSLVASAAVMGPIIPPSIPMVLYGVLAGVSISDLFVAGIVPGLMIGVALMIVCYFEAVKHDYPREAKATLREFFTVLRDAIWALMMPVVILGGILSGVFTATEAGVAAVVYALLVGMFVYRDLKWPHIKDALVGTVIATGVVMFLVATSTLFAWLITVERMPQMIAQTMLSWTSERRRPAAADQPVPDRARHGARRGAGADPGGADPAAPGQDTRRGSDPLRRDHRPERRDWPDHATGRTDAGHHREHREDQSRPRDGRDLEVPRSR